MAHAPLHPDARSFLAREVGRAREIAEKGARASLTALAVAEKVVPAHFTEAQRKLRNRLRAHARQLGDERTADGQQEVGLLAEEVAYQHWHRMLFARFLAENGLLREDEGDQPIDLEECRALAADRRLDIWVYAALCAQKMLPGVFRLDDPALELKLDGAAQVELNGLMAGLKPEVFKATDALGWVYQFWQAKRKDEVNASGVKIGAKEISPVTQLFTEDYMVDFLLHNTLGAWWAGKLGPIEACSEEEARAKAALPPKNGLPAVEWTYLRLAQDAESKKWTPSAGIFEGWPKEAKEITFLDPCMGSGHFQVFALPILARIRMEEGGNAAENIHAVLKDQIYGLELDHRCCQIGAFNIALTAWKIADYQLLPTLNVACCGIKLRGELKEWVSLAGEDQKARIGMEQLYRLFKNAPILGSLIDPRDGRDDLFCSKYAEISQLLKKALSNEDRDYGEQEMAVSAQGLAFAAELLAAQYVLVATNVPYLGRDQQVDELKQFCSEIHPEAKNDLSTCFIERCLAFSSLGGSVALVTPQNWLFLGRYKELRKKLLTSALWNCVIRLGPRAFETITGEVVKASLLQMTKGNPDNTQRFNCIDASTSLTAFDKAQLLRGSSLAFVKQHDQLLNPDSRIIFGAEPDLPRLDVVAASYHGQGSRDSNRFMLCWWELPMIRDGWIPLQTTVNHTSPFGGGHYCLLWENGEGRLADNIRAYAAQGSVSPDWNAGIQCWGKQGILISQTGVLAATIYLQQAFDSNSAVIQPFDPKNLPAVWAYCSSNDYQKEVRKIDQKLNVTNATLVKVPFDLEHWSKVAEDKLSNRLPLPFSSDPTQWLFNGHPQKSDYPLQVAVTRLLCYQYPRQTGSSFPDCPALGSDNLDKHADDDGIVALRSINREDAAAPRVRALLKDAYESDWHDGVTERQILADAGHGDSTLEEWLRDSFFEEHCKLFHHRPFVWHIWDGERDGFHALVNYHRLAAPNGEGARLLQKLAQTYLGDWIARCEADVKNDKPNAYKLLKAAKDLQADLLKILEGEAPHDIFVRWKPLHEQSVGWNPDINDGVRLNIRPFLTVRDVGKKGAGILKFKPNIKWEKDRGSEPERLKAQFPWFWSCLPEDKPEHVTDFAGGAEFTGERWNNLHHTLAAKKAARAKFSPKK